jgi:hypothetical protein
MNTYEKSMMKDTLLSGGLTLFAAAWLVVGGLQNPAQSIAAPGTTVVATTHAPAHAA